MVPRRSCDELDRMRIAGQIVARVLRGISEMVRPGLATRELDAAAEEIIRKAGGIPSFKGYHGYPASVCASVNDEIVHGIPGPRVLEDGDVVSIDVGAIWQGYHGDAAVTVPVGSVSEAVATLIRATEASLQAGIAAVREGARMGDVSHAIERVARDAGCEVVREYGGHGIGQAMHEPPSIRNWGPPGGGLRLREGMTFCLEPMLTLGGYSTKVLDDGWTVVTADGSVSAHFEHTVLVTENGAEILTLPPEDQVGEA
ncbi:MAG: type I methionyl aminopeptidase [Chloroflexi bacterium]|nr:type I methionyl aminopeptidase [Chloroflexota bacterium]